MTVDRVANENVEHKCHTSVSDEEARTRVKLPKKLIVCCDGTWMDSDNGWVKGKWGQPGHLQNPTNVTRIVRAIASEDKGHHPQIVYYQAGVGTGIGLYNQIVGGGTGLGLAENVREAYAFIASNYAEHDRLVPNDAIFLIGFSRGAYTARTLGGFICAMGVLKRHAMPHFFEIFEDWNRAGDPHYEPMFFKSYFKHHKDVKPIWPSGRLARSKKDRDAYLQEYFQMLQNLNMTQRASINCIGVWDTVGALGIPVNPVIQRIFPFLPSFVRTYRWFDTRLDSLVKNAFHALALDERRFPYYPAMWERRPGCTSNLRQVWFPGAHSNIGGSYEDAGIANITLAWMMDQLAGNTLEQPEDFRHHDWIQFDDELLDTWYDCTSDWAEDHKDSSYKGWARGKIYDSNTFPQSLAGQKTRLPGRYHGTFYESGNEDPQRLLEDTNEYIHSSVRARIDMGGNGVEADSKKVFLSGLGLTALLASLWRRLTGRTVSTYQPQLRKQPLHGWRLQDGHKSHEEPNWDIDMSPDGSAQEVTWVFEGDGKATKCTMPEARLDKYERYLLQKDQELADKIEFTNAGWKWTMKEQERPQKRGRTWPFADACRM
ncbi:hypothetical protein KC332_g10863 [Hortaea werneckii]|uniref:T6SS Phospholipase effector Tle1-like catalytic domain-containing protein n=2 Tax=Hortaea werneckii TaxID=91943 RepID=A0A3M7IGB9_HORWE|nr:hypothetical protein KC350_g15823 [Hortaea werneckii]OTA37552.1 hypothetical protein BTJ68_02827 [Hortaea werneckii EXF-2000]KAI6814592.1 hypothetical protein KC358_g11126 [Hortaea werneckii]KAI6902674.1 hypothetical protein KC348_g15997 [Hortaea werneckii]KAI6921635.1 hypothetical protein KC341_g15821 [Hortaea werneckii]